MKFSLTLALLALSLVSTAAAYAVTGGSVYVNRGSLLEIDPNSKDTHRITLNSAKDVVSFSLAVQGDHKPHQLMYMLSDNNGLDHAVFAVYKDGQAVADISANKVPSALKKSDRIFVSLIAADALEEEANVIFPVVELIPSDALKESVGSDGPVRLGAQPEIHHVFNTEEPTVNGVVPVVFSAFAVALFVFLVVTWTNVLGNELFAGSPGATWNAALLATLASFEYTFFKYYMGASIFTTAFNSMVLTAPALFFGSRALKSLGQARGDGKA
ncbi:hypothetical protein METBIDRAFT_39983 [Metschnikowia bicuspidata var. bicuspidata NRRL YB-4993]|uniref:Ribophorin II C-terminal domain-containing protein n=1 Tax=Metschnikowia bicuspidata var. bicuspidata NRRL YB-4993 TaxID=869754 RepID=A0A1A0HEE0_9ASCO|nr:hypothetical protein METBIDRAFT_39983 [Metschnikowia bicuspidata var. bicuspidata NRRL YB-4993]OBA22479.1 hypothetical protein METBIDRAFT_39983 [Metschnikowia bicuspidata var. bicuspidata NRRL YB-4993]